MEIQSSSNLVKPTRKISERRLVVRGVLLLLGLAWLYHYSYLFYTPKYVDYVLHTSGDEGVKLRVSGRYVSMIYYYSGYISREMLKGGMVEFIPLEVPNVEMPVVDGYSIPIKHVYRKDTVGNPVLYHTYDSELLTLRGGNYSESRNIKINNSRLELAMASRKLAEFPSETPGFKMYKPKNYQQRKDAYYTYFLSESKQYLFECPAKCVYTSTYKNKISYQYMFNREELPHYEKIDASVHKLIQQFIDDAND